MAHAMTKQTPLMPAIDSLKVCTDCVMWLINGETSDDDLHRLHMQEGERELLASYASVTMGDASRDDEFSAAPCDCCRTRLAGVRHHMLGYQCRTVEATQ